MTKHRSAPSISRHMMVAGARWLITMIWLMFSHNIEILQSSPYYWLQTSNTFNNGYECVDSSRHNTNVQDCPWLVSICKLVLDTRSYRIYPCLQTRLTIQWHTVTTNIIYEHQLHIGIFQIIGEMWKYWYSTSLLSPASAGCKSFLTIISWYGCYWTPSISILIPV